jgi:Flp pilus assembly protein TadG
MKTTRSEKGQALILIALAAIGLFGFTALAIDGSRKFSDRRHAQNAADAAALAAALASSRGADDPSSTTTATGVANTNGYDGGASSDVTVIFTATPAGLCPPDTTGKDITVNIDSVIPTTFARVLRFDQLTNKVSATARECGSFIGPPFGARAVVALARNGRAFDGTGTPDWLITGGGIFSNSGDGDAAYCNGAAGIITPSVDVVGGTDFRCHGTSNYGTVDETQAQYTATQIQALMPRSPACDGVATLSGGQYHPQAGADGSRLNLGNGGDFAPGLYCIMNDPAPINAPITGTEVTFYVPNAIFSLTMAGNGAAIVARAPTSGEYDGVLFYLAPQFDANGNLIQTQQIDMRGNDNNNVTGSILAPSADITMFGNSGTASFDSQIVGYRVDSGGNANIAIKYKINHNYQAALPITLTLLR